MEDGLFVSHSGLDEDIENLRRWKIEFSNLYDEFFHKLEEMETSYLRDMCIPMVFVVLFKYQNLEITSIYFNFKSLNNKIIIEVYLIHNNKSIIIQSNYRYINSNKISMLNNFYGQLKSIEFSIFKQSQNNNDKQLYYKIISPLPLKDNGILFSSIYRFKSIKYDFFILDNLVDDSINYDINDLTIIDIKIELKIKDINLVKVNYINYNEKEFNIIDYFGGIIQFLPFLKIFNGLYRNKEILKTNNIKKTNILINFINNIILIIFKYITNSGKKNNNIFKNIGIFYYIYLIK